MTIEEAIKRLSRVGCDARLMTWEDDKKAVKLGIEALKAWEERRENYPMLNTYRLPGETDS